MVKPFYFKLEKILAFRKQLEDQAKLALSQALQAEDAQLELLNRLQTDWQACLAHMAADKQMTQADLWLWTGYKKRLESDKELAQNTLKKLQNQVGKLRQDLVSKTTQRKLLEKLRTKQADKHVQTEQDKEQKEFDETATLRYRRTLY